MGNTSKILLVALVLVLSGVGFAFFVKTKRRQAKEAKLNPPPTTTPHTETPKLTTPVPTTLKESNVESSIQLDIHVPSIDTENRRFEYTMHYQGIQYKGTFVDGVTTPMIQVKKGFGSFLIQQLQQTVDPQKVRSGKANKMSGTTSTPVQNDLVSLSILDLKGQTLKAVNVNLATGVQKSLNTNHTSNLKTL
ncbi:hypothetical protein [Aureispira sp. CCB-E]|uniref:hypothetical protein n=1 Tax=Aureispira sp. CCB-E TaxID=3051121 RepID=UPI0028687AE3|nr:hypothetical protein [Aureispira sp. CCB-E]WMX15280.1 hypothetical protein QP953_02705 [Aureispira sp. CCB-E]